jgi:mono/diheme cytochrome c family protein
MCVLCAALGLALAALYLFGLTPSAGAAPVSFINDVAPILKKNCFVCHGVKNPKGKLDMTKYETFRKGGTKDDPISPGKPDESFIILALTANDKTRMPPMETADPLKKEEIAVIEQWIKEGAKLDEDLTPKSDLQKELRIRWKPPELKAAYTAPVEVTAVAFSPDNAKLVVGGNHELEVWNVADGKLEKRVRTRTRRSLSMAFLPDGKLVVAGGRPSEEGDVRVYDLNGGTPKMQDGVAILDGVNDKGVLIKHLYDTDDEVMAVAVSPDGKKIAAGGCDRIVNVWDVSEGYDKVKLDQSFENHADFVFGVAFAPDGTHLLTCSRDKTAKLWDLTTKESVLTFPDHQNYVTGVAIKSDGKVGYSAGGDNQLRSWNAAGDAAGKQQKVVGNHGKPILKLVQHPKLPIMATCSADGTVKTWNPETGAALKTMAEPINDEVFSVAISPDGNFVAAGAYNGVVKVWKAADGSVVKTFNASVGYEAAAPKK